ncbi:hypothetical protein KFK09_028443 [Dendrobium nobile]|uniref:Endonuclease/exonuclease/phosphatase domain-containing protein n=1 Tax=Dendrobium nobile TaxID=94219 RepID=A0A8T3A1X5_DENNO|nr:hypothetical protein KFK09_028443 [Dendrobium nobile]
MVSIPEVPFDDAWLRMVVVFFLLTRGCGEEIAEVSTILSTKTKKLHSGKNAMGELKDPVSVAGTVTKASSNSKVFPIQQNRFKLLEVSNETEDSVMTVLAEPTLEGAIAIEVVACNEVAHSNSGKIVEETKFSSFDKVEISKLLGNEWDFFLYPSDGASGGIIVLWKANLAKFSLVGSSPQCVSGKLDIFNKGTWMISTVYGNKSFHLRRRLWEQLEGRGEKDIPMVVGGDFNCILAQDEKMGGKKFTFSQGPQEMRAFMTKMDLHDVGLVGPKFTWCNNKTWNARMLERLDRCFLNTKALDEIHNAAVSRANLLDMRRYGPHIRHLKLLFRRLGVNQLKLEESNGEGLSTEKLMMLRSKTHKFNVTVAKINTWWRQRAKVRWIQENDMNSNFFHSVANGRRLGNAIRQLKNEDGILVEEHADIEGILFKFFIDKWKKRSFHLEGWPLGFQFLSEFDSLPLQAEFTLTELELEIQNCSSIVSPGLDGITFSFFKNY